MGTDTEDHERECGRECIRAAALRTKSSKSYFVWYLILIIMNAFVLIWELFCTRCYQKPAIAIEGIITFLFASEVVIEIVSQEFKFFFVYLFIWHNIHTLYQHLKNFFFKKMGGEFANKSKVYFNYWSNRIDAFVCFLCVVLWIFFVSVEKPEGYTHHSVESLLDIVIVGARYSIQAIRFCRFAHQGQKNRENLRHENVVFDKAAIRSFVEQHNDHFERFVLRMPKKTSLDNDDLDDMDNADPEFELDRNSMKTYSNSKAGLKQMDSEVELGDLSGSGFMAKKFTKDSVSSEEQPSDVESVESRQNTRGLKIATNSFLGNNTPVAPDAHIPGLHEQSSDVSFTNEILVL
ncbi:hypothetical protein RFI_17824 [Reticulomyxa filosa]|uniref:Ion transport domain-containing protein n=1 Tax=Reticulomyxa filosa TaxID=46433 RepID=X6N294_RETFI|nr:hypothetical protein RFI_17824 [Reticulomyxa filosa]|eukprot:ETO19412.1 hypothetical protein RFI_17824 [Reticulomyxa filosa]